MRKAFTLMEVNLAILIMAGGILSIVSLYSLAYRENRQSREDVAGAAYADAVISPLVIAASATNLEWSAFRQEFNYPSDAGWEGYFNNDGSIISSPESVAGAVFSSAMSQLKGSNVGQSSNIPKGSSYGDLIPGLVVMHEQDSAIVKISFRAAKNPKELLAMPLYYTEVRFQGDPTK